MPTSPGSGAADSAGAHADFSAVAGASAASTVAAPQLSLPKGGGAIRGMGEKLAINPVSGTGSVSVPIALSPGRDGFGPTLTLGYDSAAGNGPFGLGWSLDVPRVQVSTDKRLPLYHPSAPDGDDADVYVLSGAEDLVPVLGADGRRLVTTSADGRHTIHRYRPRVEDAYARIERWTATDGGDVHWRSWSGQNVLTVYGRDLASRIVDPAEPARVFAWLVCETRDRRGNAVIYGYKPEDGAGAAPAAAHQANRGPADDARRGAQRYLKRIRYGNQVPLLAGDGGRPQDLTTQQADGAAWMFEVVLDYGEHDPAMPTPRETAVWPHRPDAFSSYRSGFEIRTARLCRRFLVFHHFPGEDGVGVDCLVRSTTLAFTAGADPRAVSPPEPPVDPVTGPGYTYLRSVTAAGHVRRGPGYLRRPMPPLEFDYSTVVFDPTIRELQGSEFLDLPPGPDSGRLWWTDLHGEGLSGVLAEAGGEWYYSRNLGPAGGATVRLGASELVASRPNVLLADRGVHLVDLAGDGRLDVTVLDGPVPGFFEHDDADGWTPFRHFTAYPNRTVEAPNSRLVDLDGDGHPDLVITEDEGITWYPSLGEAGFADPRHTAMALDEERGPRLVFSDEAWTGYLADMSGDGLVDLVRITGTGEICYWPNLGHGRFGSKVSMDAAPRLSDHGTLDPGRLLLADVDGTGTTDLVHLGADGARVYFNLSGNGWSREPAVWSPSLSSTTPSPW